MIECSNCGWRHTVPCGRDDCPHEGEGATDPARILKSEGSPAIGSADDISLLRAQLAISEQARARAEQERDEFKTLASVGTWHAECRPNREQAARELAKSQAVIDKLADEISRLKSESIP